MRVLIFSTAYWPMIGGAEIAVKEITDRLPGLEFVLVTARLSPELPAVEKVGAVEVHRLGRGTALDKLRLVLSGARYAERLGPVDRVWAIMASYGGFAALRYTRRFPKVSFLLTLQEGDSRAHIYARVWWCWPWFRAIFRRADRIQAISSYLADWATKLGAKTAPVIVPNGVNLEQFSPLAPEEVLAERQAVRSRLTIPDTAPVVVTVSRLETKNGVHDLIEAWPKLSADCHLVVIGSGSLESRLKKRSVELGISDRLHFLGSVPHSELPRYLRMSDIFCRPSRSEGLGNAFLEAMAVGLPVVGTSVGGIVDFLRDGETGVVAPVADPTGLAAVLENVCADSALRERVGAKGQALVREHYSWDHSAEAMRSFITI